MSSDFRASVRIESHAVGPPAAGEVVVENLWAGVNASDINFAAGAYSPGRNPPLFPGFEAVSRVLAVGPGVSHVKAGESVVWSGYGAFSEACVVKASTVIPVPSPSPHMLPVLVSGLTASLALDGELHSGNRVLVTAAAGGTGTVCNVQKSKRDPEKPSGTDQRNP